MGCSLTPSSRHHCIQSYSIISRTVTLPPPKYISMAGKQDSTAKAIETNKWNPHPFAQRNTIVGHSTLTLSVCMDVLVIAHF